MIVKTGIKVKGKQIEMVEATGSRVVPGLFQIVVLMQFGECEFHPLIRGLL